MDFFPWKDEYSLGIEEMDTQHRLLVGIINRLYIAMDERKDKERLEGILDELLDYANTHFTSEEALMRKQCYPKASEHEDLHSAFEKDILERMAKLSDGELSSSFKLAYWLKDWLLNHILREDMAYGPRFRVGRP